MAHYLVESDFRARHIEAQLLDGSLRSGTLWFGSV